MQLANLFVAIFRSILILERNSEPVTIPKHSYSLLQLYFVVSLRGVEYGVDTRTNYKSFTGETYSKPSASMGVTHYFYRID